MGTRGWMLPTFIGCCLWILHGLGTTAAAPVTTEGPFAATPSQSEAPTALLLGTVGTRTVNDTVMAESILASPTMSPSFPSWAEPDSVTETTGYISPLGAERDAGLSTGEVTQAPTGVPQAGTDMVTSLDATQKNQSVLATATAAVTPQPNFTPSTKHNITGTTAAAPSGSTPVFADVPASTTRAGGALDSTADAMFLPSVTIPTTAGTLQTLTTTPLHTRVTALPPAAGAEVEGVTLPGDSQGDGRAPSSIPSPGASGLLPKPWTKIVSGTVGDTPGWAALEPGDVGDAANGVFSTADSSQLPAENVTALGTAENPGQSSLLAGQAGPSPTDLLESGDGDKQGAPAVLLPPGPGSVLADSEAPAAPGVRGDTATLLPDTDVQSDADIPAADTGVPLPTEAVDLAESSLQPWLSPIGEEQSLLGADPPAPTGTSGAPSTPFPPPGVAAGSLPETDGGTEAVVSPDYSADLGVSLSPSLQGLQPWGTAADGPSTSLNSVLGATNPSSSVPDGAALSAAGQQAQGDTGAGDTTQAEDAGDGSPYENTQSDTSPAASSIQQGPTDITPGAVPHTELSPASAPGEGALAPALSPYGPATLSHNLSGAGGSGPLPIEALGAPGAALPPPAAVDGAVFGPDDRAETAVSSDFGAAPREPASPSLGASQPWDTAAGAPEDTALPGAEGPGTGINSALNSPSTALYGPVGPPSPDIVEQPGTGLTVLGVEGQALGGVSSAAAFESSLSSSPVAGLTPETGLLPGAGSPPSSASQSDVLAVPSISDSDGAAAPIPAAAPGSAVPSLGSAYGEGGPELTVAQGINSAGGVAQAEIPESQSPYTDTNPAVSSISIQQGPADTASGAVLHTELSPAPAPGEGALAPALSPYGLAAPSRDLSGAEGSEPLPIEALGAPGAALSPPAAVDGAVFEANNGAEAAVSSDFGAAPGEPASPSLGASQPWDTAAGAPEDTALPGAEGPGSGFSSVLDAPSSASYGSARPPSPGIGVQPGTGLTAPGAEGQAPGGVSSTAAFEPSLSSSPGTGLKAGTDLLPAALSPWGLASPSDVLTAPSASDTAGPSVLGGAGGAPSALQPSLVAAPGLHPAAVGVHDGAEAVSADGEAPGQSQDQTGTEVAVASDGRLGAALLSIASSPSADGSSLPEAAAGADTGAGIPRVGGAGSSSGLGAAALQSNKETPVLLPTTQSNANVRPPGAKLSQVNVVELAGGKLGASAQGSPSASGGNGLGTVIQIASGVLSPSIPTSPQETQPLVPVAASASARGVGDSSVPNVGPASASSTQSGSSPPALPWSPVDETASGMLAPLGEELQSAPNAAPALPSASERENLKEGAATSPQLSSLVSASEWAAGARGAAAAGGAALLLPPLQHGVPAAIRGDADGPTLTNAARGGAGGVSIPASIPVPGAAQRGSTSATPLPAVSCSPTPSPGDKMRLMGLGASGGSTIGTHVSSSMLPAPGQPAAAPTPPPLPTVPAVPLYGYGARENDHEYVQRRVDFNSPLFKPETGFPFGKTLRDSLYFTDNGQIIFPASDSSILTLPNPPARGFTGREGVPMIAVFWDNADFSRGTGTTFYQEFLTLNSEKPPFIRDVEAKIRRYLRSSYSAAWTLKITWEKAPAYGARGNSRRTNTYQAVLTTDGFRSYVLILYQDGGMQWDYTQLPATNVLIGYTSGDGYYRNDDLTQGSPAAKYRPDRYRGYNTDLRGLWLYKLESRVGINYRLKCLAWTGRQQEPQAWSQDLPACPCSLQQGQQDQRFRSGRGGWGSARVSMLHSASPNSHGAGVRCLYDGRGQLVEGRQERYWRASRQASPYRDQELKLYDWCCNQAGSARLCARYSKKRPRIGCDGYRAHSADDSSEDSNSEEQRDEEEE